MEQLSLKRRKHSYLEYPRCISSICTLIQYSYTGIGPYHELELRQKLTFALHNKVSQNRQSQELIRQLNIYKWLMWSDVIRMIAR